MDKIQTGKSELGARTETQRIQPPSSDASATENIPDGSHFPRIETEKQSGDPQQTSPIQQQHRDRYTDISEFSPVGYLMLSRMGVIKKLNSNASMLLGVDFNDLLLHPFERFVVPEYLGKWHRYFESMIRQDGITVSELALKHGSGALFHARLEFQGVATYEKATVLRITLTDITERRRAEQETIRLLHRNQMLMNTSLDGIHVMDIQGNLLEANDAFCRMLGYTQEEMAHLNVTDWDAKLTADELRLAFRKIIGTSIVIETIHRRKDGTRINVEINASGSNIDGFDYIFASSRDITERKRIESSLEETTRQLRELGAKHEASLEEERKSIAREVHDELGQILTSLRIAISVMRIRFSKDNEELSRMVLNMAGLTDQAIHGVRNVAENLRPIALDIGIVPAIEWLSDNFTMHTGISCTLHAPDEFVHLDNSRAIVLFRIVQESLTNVTRHAEAKKVIIMMSLKHDNLYLEVRDDGKGFDKGAALKRRSYGLLGMSERALLLGGQVDISSKTGHGTVVSMCIPINLKTD